MCTLIVAVQHFKRAPLIVAANRDERLNRPATPPARWEGEPFIAPRDEQARGTWLGLSDRGFFVGLTNRFMGLDAAARALAGEGATRESRGALVVEALRASSPAALHASLASLSPQRFQPFHLLYADTTSAFVTWSDGARVHQDTLGAGVHVVTERSPGGDDRARTERIAAALVTIDATSEDAPSPEALKQLLRIHAPDDPVAGTCVHLPHLGYGTRSSMVFFSPSAARPATLLWAEGAPCTTPYEDLSSLMRERWAF